MQSLTGKITGSTLTAAEWNQLPDEVQNVIESLGIVLSSGDLNQLNKAIAGYASHGDYYTESGAADAYVLAPTGSKVAPPAYVAGFRVRFIAGNVNTGASTINVGGLGVKSIKALSGNDPAAGSINGNMVMIYDGTNFVISGPGISSASYSIFTAGGSYTKPAGLRFVEVVAVGAGGSGGGANTTNDSLAGGGGGGATASAIILASALSASEAVTIGAGGVGTTGAGGAGGVTSLGSLVVADGGSGGLQSNSGGTSAGSAGGSGTTGDILLDGGDGNHASAISGSGGDSTYSGRSRSVQSNNAGSPGKQYGGGGSGAVRRTTDQLGGDGADGIVIIKESF